MKTNIFKLFLFSICFCGICFSQTSDSARFNKKLVGVWQGGDKTIGAGYTDLYIFTASGKFYFIVSSYNYLSRLQRIEGTYTVADTTIKFAIQSATEKRGGHLAIKDFDGDELIYIDDTLLTLKVRHPNDMKYFGNIVSNKKKPSNINFLDILFERYFFISKDIKAFRGVINGKDF